MVLLKLVSGDEVKKFPGRHFNLLRWFSLTALISVAAISALAAWALSAFLTHRMIRQEAEVTADFVRSIVAVERAYDYFERSESPTAEQFQQFLSHMALMPQVVRANVYSAERRVLWSSDPSIIGRRFDRNDELDRALAANLVVNSGVIKTDHMAKPEHVNLAARTRRFVESYIPILDEKGKRVVGVVELYTQPESLFSAIRDGEQIIWLAAAIAAVFLYLALFWIVYRAHGMIESQREKLVESEALAVVGEMASAVAHGLRNPLASIRSSAELAQEIPLPLAARECTDDIVAEVDRLEGWVDELLRYAKPALASPGPVDINAVLATCLAGFGRDLKRRGIASHLHLAPALPPVRADETALGQVIGNLIANAVEALDSGGEILITSAPGPAGTVLAEVRDNGPGISRDSLNLLFRSFHTTKSKGLGLGLLLVRRLVERLGGSIEVDSTPGRGTAMRLLLPAWK